MPGPAGMTETDLQMACIVRTGQWGRADRRQRKLAHFTQIYIHRDVHIYRHHAASAPLPGPEKPQAQARNISERAVNGKRDLDSQTTTN